MRDALDITFREYKVSPPHSPRRAGTTMRRWLRPEYAGVSGDNMKLWGKW